MKVTLLNKVLQERGWQLVRKHQSHHLLRYVVNQQPIHIILPARGSEEIPTGTLNATLRAATAKGKADRWLTTVLSKKTVNVVLEKQSDGVWGRIELPGLLVVTRGCSAESITNALQTLLAGFASDELTSERSLLETMTFVPVYDMTAVWDLFKQLKANHIAGRAGIELDLIGQFMTGATFPGAEQAVRLESSIHALGRQLLEVSIR